MARSRSSLVAGIFAAHGCWAGEVRNPDQWNKTGYFENKHIKRLIRRSRPHPNSYHTILKGMKPYPGAGYEALLDTVKANGYKGGPWLSKVDAFAWPLYPGHFVKVWRDKEGILSSIRRTPFMKRQGFTEDQWHAIIDAHHEEMRELEGVDIDTDRLVEGDHSAIRAAVEAYGIEYDERHTNRCLRIV